MKPLKISCSLIFILSLILPNAVLAITVSAFNRNPVDAVAYYFQLEGCGIIAKSARINLFQEDEMDTAQFESSGCKIINVKFFKQEMFSGDFQIFSSASLASNTFISWECNSVTICDVRTIFSNLDFLISYNGVKLDYYR